MKSDRILDETDSSHMHRGDANGAGLSDATRADQHGEQATDNQSGERLLHHHLLSRTAGRGRSDLGGSFLGQCRLSVFGYAPLTSLYLHVVSILTSSFKSLLHTQSSIERVRE